MKLSELLIALQDHKGDTDKDVSVSLIFSSRVTKIIKQPKFYDYFLVYVKKISYLCNQN